MSDELPEKCCGRCQFYDGVTPFESLKFDEPSGYCRRFPPFVCAYKVHTDKTFQEVLSDDTVHPWAWRWPVVMEDPDWCGEFQPVKAT